MKVLNSSVKFAFGYKKKKRRRTCRKPLGSFSLMTSIQYSISPVV